MEFSYEDIKLTRLESAAKLIIEFESPWQLHQFISVGNRNKFDQYLYAVDEIQKSIKSGMTSGYETHGTRAIKTLQLVFRGILECSISATISDSSSSPVYSSSGTSSNGYELQGSNRTFYHKLSSEQVYYLRNIVRKLNSRGCLGDCTCIYRISRKSAVDAKLPWLCIWKWTTNDLQNLDRIQFATKIEIWIQAANICYSTIFPRERQYFEQIFDGVSTVTYDNCFLAIVEHVAIELNNFADAASSIASFQNLFAVLDLYEALLVLLPEIETMFHSVSSTKISYGATRIIKNLKILVRKLFCSFEDTVLNEVSNTPLSEGTIHSLTEYAMNYVTRISLHRKILADIIVSKPAKSLGNQEDDQFLDTSDGTPLELHMIWIIISLKINLERKSRAYKDSTSRYVFITNNVIYILKTIKACPELEKMTGEEYPLKLSNYIMQAAQDYFSSIWHRVLYCLRDDGLNNKFPFYNGISRKSVKNRFKTFNTTFKEVCQTQSRIFVADIHIHHQLHKLILNTLLPAYESFLEKYGSHLQGERYKERYIKYSTEDLKNRMLLTTEANLAQNIFE
ncbi:hypothetical protein POM88_033986 [Heracleum sosnowskyi]|uniref:Exocyst subunit Exo70 family protein n=1 Tax=Heracleum sosnowskyi TaxID=360622 RepID=A0AAD8MCQ8_9APIA|nr:hypothetical protein POM88_033986 [Heracleum sosnowskyi]